MKIDLDPKKHIANLVTDEDGEVRELTTEDFKQFRPAAEVLPELFGADLAADMLRPKKGGRPRTASPKVFTGIRLDADVLEAFRATGKGWQTRINDVLKEWLKKHAA